MNAVRLTFTLAISALLFAASPALAMSITYQIESGTESGFGFSGLHDADDSSPMSGSSLGSLKGSLVLDYDAGLGTYDFVSSTVSLNSTDYTFALTGGQLSSDGGGALDFDLMGAGPYAQTGSIVFAGGAPVCCGVDGPNRIDPTEFRLWGASDIQVSSVTGGAKRIGMDLGGAAPVPEPSAALVFAAGLLVARGAAGGRRRG